MRVLVVDDSAVVRRLVTHILDSDPGLKVIGEASGGIEAVEMTQRLRPDVITMDVHMPSGDGFDATRRIMAERPTPIVIVTASFDPADTAKAFEAIEAGAVAIIEKPFGPGDARFPAASEDLVRTVRTMGHVRVVGRRVRRSKDVVVPAPPPPPSRIDVVGIASSTGGPAAVAELLRELPASIPFPVLIVQHIAFGFDGGFARWLDSISPPHVELARPGRMLEPGLALVAPSDQHLGVSADGSCAVIEGSALVKGHRPSANVLFRSIARAFGPRAMVAVLTGMGDDGADGAADVVRLGGTVLAQDEGSSVVFGMPGSVIDRGLAHAALPPAEIGALIAQTSTRGRQGSARGG